LPGLKKSGEGVQTTQETAPMWDKHRKAISQHMHATRIKKRLRREKKFGPEKERDGYTRMCTSCKKAVMLGVHYSEIFPHQETAEEPNGGNVALKKKEL